MFHTRVIITTWWGSKHVLQHLTTSQPWIYVYMYSVHGLFPVHLSATQIHSGVEVCNKRMSSTGLVDAVCVRACACALFCLIKVKLVGKWSEKSISWRFPVFRCYSLLGSGSAWLAYLMCPCCQVRVCFCELSLWGTNRFVIYLVPNYNLFGKSTDVPAGFPKCAFAMHGIQVSWKVGVVVCLNLGSLKKGAVKKKHNASHGTKFQNAKFFYFLQQPVVM